MSASIKAAARKAHLLLTKQPQAQQDRKLATSYAHRVDMVEGFRIKIGGTGNLSCRLRLIETSMRLKLGTTFAWKTRNARQVEQRALIALSEFRQEGD